MIRKLIFALSFLIVVLTACTKEKSLDSSSPGGSGGNANTDLIGNYDFVDLHLIASSVVEISDAGWDTKTVTNSDYRTKNNVGTVTFTNTTIANNSIGYSIDTVIKAYLYDEDVLIDSFELPFTATLPISSSTSKYKKVSPDSLYYESGAPVNTGGAVTSGLPSGAKYKLENNMLTLTTPFHFTKTETVQGAQQKTTNSGVSVTRLRKK